MNPRGVQDGSLPEIQGQSRRDFGDRIVRNSDQYASHPGGEFRVGEGLNSTPYKGRGIPGPGGLSAGHGDDPLASIVQQLSQGPGDSSRSGYSELSAWVVEPQG